MKKNRASKLFLGKPAKKYGRSTKKKAAWGMVVVRTNLKEFSNRKSKKRGCGHDRGGGGRGGSPLWEPCGKPNRRQPPPESHEGGPC